jgi:hypothetical protein
MESFAGYYDGWNPHTLLSASYPILGGEDVETVHARMVGPLQRALGRVTRDNQTAEWELV